MPCSQVWTSTCMRLAWTRTHRRGPAQKSVPHRHLRRGTTSRSACWPVKARRERSIDNKDIWQFSGTPPGCQRWYLGRNRVIKERRRGGVANYFDERCVGWYVVPLRVVLILALVFPVLLVDVWVPVKLKSNMIFRVCLMPQSCWQLFTRSLYNVITSI